MDIPASVFNVLPVELATEILEGLAWDQACWSRFVEQVLVRTIRVPNPSHQPCEQFVTHLGLCNKAWSKGRWLYLTQAVWLTERDLTCAPLLSPSLRSLNFSFPGAEEVLASILSRLTRLESLSLYFDWSVDIPSIQDIGTIQHQIGTLKTLVIRHNSRISHSDFLFPVVQHLTKLTKLEYECDGKLSSLGTHLTPLINLTELALNSCSFDGQLLDSMLCNFSKLKVLRLREWDCSESFPFQFLKHLTDIEELDFDGSSSVNPTHLQYISRCRKLGHLNLTRASRITDPILESLPDTLEMLNMYFVDGVHNATPLSRLTSLRFLDVSYMDGSIRDNFAADYLSCLTNLEHLDLNYTGITDEGAQYITQLTKLTYLSFRRLPLVTDLAIPYVAQLPLLQSFNIDFTDIGDDGARILLSISTLNSLSCSAATSISEEMRKKLQAVFEMDSI